MKIDGISEPLPILSVDDLTPEELQEFNYLKGGDSLFARYEDNVYDLNDCEPIYRMFNNDDWIGCYGQSYWSAVVFKYVDGKVVFATATW